jgi:succinoglycan biosynthesis protein ExoA
VRADSGRREPRSFVDETDSGAAPRLASEGLALAVIPCLNEIDHIEPLIAHLLADADWPEALVVVADGGSTDGTCEVVARLARLDPRLRLMHNPARLQSAGVNLATGRFGRGRRWLVRVDAHADYPRNYVSGLVTAAKRVGAASVVVPMFTQGRGGFQSAAAAAQNSFLGAGGAPHRCGGPSGWVDHGHHALFDLKRFVDAGGYDETFGHNEDAEFDIRLRRAGGGIWLSRDLQVTYFPRSNPRALFKQYFGYGQGRARTLLRHRLIPKLRQCLPLAVAPAVAVMPFAVFQPVLALPALLWAFGSLFVGAALCIRQRSTVAAGAGFAAMVMHLAWSLGFWRQMFRTLGGAVGPGVPPAAAKS